MTLDVLRSSAAFSKYVEVSKKDRDQFGIGNEGLMQLLTPSLDEPIGYH